MKAEAKRQLVVWREKVASKRMVEKLVRARACVFGPCLTVSSFVCVCVCVRPPMARPERSPCPQMHGRSSMMYVCIRV